MSLTLTFTKTIDVTLDMFENIIVTALEGGSNDWYMIDTDEFREFLPEKTDKCSALTERIAKALYENPEFKLRVYDIENTEELLGTVTQESMIEALKLAEKYNYFVFKHFTDDDGDFDAVDADIIFQLATMKEVVFG